MPYALRFTPRILRFKFYDLRAASGALRLFCLSLISAFLLAACGASETPVESYRPPTISGPTPLPSPVVQPPTEAPYPSPTPDCSNGLTYVADISIPDGTTTLPGASLDKRWRVLNSGTCNWDKAYRLKLVAGSEMGAHAEQALFPARGGSEAVVRIVFIAPDEAGTHRSAWQAYDPEGQPFGDPFYIEVIVAP
jgi:hypothetical protein